ncbi:hypothetical protein SAMN05661044_01375 [Olivibacter domesticus]|uniref:Uncharacterized protein n=2 Tax=Olivibacter domesticus TaxID=407022 RepID=A0A1H7KK91_OLID1|nr:hypothetical protein SAMN05661044_01375 [Olivibacter domesticus]
MSVKTYISICRSLVRLAEDNIKAIKQQDEQLTRDILDEIRNFEESTEDSIHFMHADWILQNAIFISMYSHFEDKMWLTAYVLSEGKYLKIEDLNGNGIENYRLYIEKIGEIQQANEGVAEWGEIKHFRSIRNLLVHNGGMIDKEGTKDIEKEKLYKFLKDNDVIVAGRSGRIRIRNPKLLKRFMRTTSMFLEAIINAYNKKISN